MNVNLRYKHLPQIHFAILALQMCNFLDKHLNRPESARFKQIFPIFLPHQTKPVFPLRK